MPTPRQRAEFFHSLTELLEAGLTPLQATQQLTTSTNQRGHSKLAKALSHLLTQSPSPAAASPETAHTPAPTTNRLPQTSKNLGPFSPWEIAVLHAGITAGKLPAACRTLKRLAESEATARSHFLHVAAYPLLLAHLAIILPGIPILILAPNLLSAAAALLTKLALLWSLLGTVFILWRYLASAATSSPRTDTLLNALPLLGTARLYRAACRFASVLEWLWSGSTSLSSAFHSAARAASTAGAASAAAHINSALTNSTSFTDAVQSAPWLPSELRQALITGAQTGRLDSEMMRAASSLSEKAFSAQTKAATLLARALYLGAILLAASQILSLYHSLLHAYQPLLDGPP